MTVFAWSSVSVKMREMPKSPIFSTPSCVRKTFAVFRSAHTVYSALMSALSSGEKSTRNLLKRRFLIYFRVLMLRNLPHWQIQAWATERALPWAKVGAAWLWLCASFKSLTFGPSCMKMNKKLSASGFLVRNLSLSGHVCGLHYCPTCVSLLFLCLFKMCSYHFMVK